ncbi:hypothetical protein [Acinetobacter sp.]|uniref:hypothetical protein n=2 Tax=Acinetobacter sp. TaxID=472 RepID=UPI002FCC4F73
MNTTKILGEAAGIQRQDIIDRTEEQTAEGLTGAVILGRFKRGRVDAPMAIHQGNIRGQLGHDPKNPDYIAVQDCLDAGVPSVQVLRLGQNEEDDGSETDPPDGKDRFVISCTPPEVQQRIVLNKVRDTLPFLTFNNVVFDIYINGTPAASRVSLLDAAVMDLHGLKVEDLTGNGRKISITPKLDKHGAFELRPTFMPSFTDDTDIEEGHVVVEKGSFHFCLAAVVTEPKLEGLNLVTINRETFYNQRFGYDWRGLVTINNNPPEGGDVRSILEKYGIVIINSQENNVDYLIENTTLNSYKVKIDLKIQGTVPLLSNNRNTSALVTDNVLAFNLTPRRMEVLVIPSRSEIDHIGPVGNLESGVSYREFINARFVVLRDWFDKKYSIVDRGKPIRVPQDAEINFIIPENINIVNFSVQNQHSIYYASNETLYYEYINPVCETINPEYQNTSAAACLGAAVYVGMTDGGLYRSSKPWNNALLTLEIYGLVMSQGGSSGGYIIDNDVIWDGHDGYPAIVNLDGDCSLKAIIKPSGKLYAGGGGAGLCSGAEFTISSALTGRSSIYKVPSISGGNGAPFGNWERSYHLETPYQVSQALIFTGAKLSEARAVKIKLSGIGLNTWEAIGNQTLNSGGDAGLNSGDAETVFTLVPQRDSSYSDEALRAEDSPQITITRNKFVSQGKAGRAGVLHSGRNTEIVNEGGLVLGNMPA